MKLTRQAHATLVQLDKERASTAAMDDAQYQAVLRLEKLGLVKLHPRYTGQRAKGQCRGHLDGYDITVTSAGKVVLTDAARP